MLKKLIGLVVFFALCWFGFDFRENHKSTGYKAVIVKLTETADRLEKKADRLETERDKLASSNEEMLELIKAKMDECKELGHPWDIAEDEEKDGEVALDAGIS